MMLNPSDSTASEAQIIARTARLLMPFKAVRIEVLDQHGEQVRTFDESGRTAGFAVASGFFMQEVTGLYLYTCWHVVTGINLHNPVLPGARAPARRMSLRVSMQANDQRAGGFEAIGGVQEVEIPLYDCSTMPPQPMWEQDEHSVGNAALELANLAQPFWHDVVRIRAPESTKPSDIQVLTRTDLWTSFVVSPGDVLLVVGYPYGYSAIKGQPTPIVLSRSVAAARLDGSRRQEVLIDGGGAPGMSGGPVFYMNGGRLYLFGVYTGILFPDAPRAAPERATALGAVCQLGMIDHLPFVRAAATSGVDFAG